MNTLLQVALPIPAPDTGNLWGYGLFLIAVIICYYIIHVLSKKNSIDGLKLEVIELKSQNEIIKKELIIERKEREALSRKYNAIRVGFRIMYKQYQSDFKEEPDRIAMMEELNKIINPITE